MQEEPQHLQRDVELLAAAADEERGDGEAGADGAEVIIGVHGTAVREVRAWGGRGETPGCGFPMNTFLALSFQGIFYSFLLTQISNTFHNRLFYLQSTESTVLQGNSDTATRDLD